MNDTAPESGRSLSIRKESTNPAARPAAAPTTGINPIPAEARTRTALPFELWTKEESCDRMLSIRSLISVSEVESIVVNHCRNSAHSRLCRISRSLQR